MPQGKKSYSDAELIKLSDGDSHFVKKMIDLFVEHGSATVEEMVAALSDSDFKTLSVLAHRLKSTVRLLGIEAIQEEVKMLEHPEKYNLSKEEIEEMTCKVRDEIYIVIDEIQNTDQKLH